MLLTTILWLCTFGASLGDEGTDFKIVKTTQGPVRGYRDPEGGLFAFYSIPYATAPTGPRKFKAPLPPPMWLETFEAVDKQIICPQVKLTFSKYMNMQENCLIANVYVPDTEEKNLSVIVYVHGGAYQIGYGNLLTPKHLVRSKNIIVVTFNYRLGAHGFLCLGTDDAPGNAGMKDQVAALRWVNKNIEKFGGNPGDVTIAGYSAGATSVDLLSISKSAAGLFHQVIVESGSNLMNGGIVTDPLENAKIFAASLGFTDLDDVYSLEFFYKEVPLDDLIKDGIIDRPNSTLLFSPCIERDTEEKEFLTDTPENILKQGKYPRVPMLYGFAQMEGLIRIKNFDSWKQGMNTNFSEFLPGNMQFENKQQRENVAKQVKEFYFGDVPVSEENILKYVDYFGDVIFKYPMLRTVKLHLENGHDKIYLYEYSYTEAEAPVVPYTDVRGADHVAQTYAVLDAKNMTVRSEVNISEDFKRVKSIVRSFWANFAKSGEPVPSGSALPSWEPAGAGRSPHMHIAESPQLRGELLPNRARFWDRLYDTYYRAPVSPPTPPPRHTEL